MWPFTSEKSDSAEIAKELPEDLKQFFTETNPEPNHRSIFEVSPEQKRVNEVLLRAEKDKTYSDEFERYKHVENAKKVCSINCAEIQQEVLECFKSWKFAGLETPCTQEIKRTSQCMEIQKAALKKLYYDDCVSIPQCNQIRYIIDKLFVENFGQLGDNVNDETKAKYAKDLDKVFYKIWR
ncbi:predicted protein [Scheffersomyces stipitis CBS 6054]|uniref:Uncharacterized protein n=1 Tax=Scheffersomyces stipitis (strain ATCC 58785 / CBS 6054 / NBRC 10063 / NRRL Y-11545) TaxID=322104 RepID=A3LQ37_PICST|nr:predicted protein [Scheffersomyces stipitis CBS 6054]ABN65145.1 predicted protein [Scheffersomyces stipitis CBS 6054]